MRAKNSAVEQSRSFTEERRRGEFSPWVLAVAVRYALDGVALRLRENPEVEPQEYARELVTLFDLATREEAP